MKNKKINSSKNYNCAKKYKEFQDITYEGNYLAYQGLPKYPTKEFYPEFDVNSTIPFSSFVNDVVQKMDPKLAAYYRTAQKIMDKASNHLVKKYNQERKKENKNEKESI